MGFDPKSGDTKRGTGWEETLHDAGAHVEEDLKRVIAYINDEVVPEVRKNGSMALRVAAEQMEKLAQKMDAAAKDGTKK